MERLLDRATCFGAFVAGGLLLTAAIYPPLGLTMPIRALTAAAGAACLVLSGWMWRRGDPHPDPATTAQHGDRIVMCISNSYFAEMADDVTADRITRELQRLHEAIRDAVESNGGYILEMIAADGFAVWPGDAADPACRSALRIAEVGPLHVGLSAGSVLVIRQGACPVRVLGDVVNAAIRLAGDRSLPKGAYATDAVAGRATATEFASEADGRLRRIVSTRPTD